MTDRAEAEFKKKWEAFIAFEKGEYNVQRIFIYRGNLVILSPEAKRYMQFRLPAETADKMKEVFGEDLCSKITHIF